MKFELVKQHKRIVSLLGIILIFIITFQNCGGNFQSAKESSGETSSASVATNGSGNDNGTPMDPGGGGAGALNPIQQMRVNCGGNFNPPTLGAVSVSEVNMTSGLDTTSGDGANPTFSINGTLNIINATVQANNNCDVDRRVETTCDIQTPNATYPASFTRAIDMAGNNVTATTANELEDLIDRAVDLGNCDGRVMTNGSGTASLRLVRQANQNPVRCVQGSFYIRVGARHEQGANAQGQVTGRNSSTPKYIKVNLNDGCWNESRLKLASNNELPISGQAGAATTIDGNWAAVLASDQSVGSTLNAGAVHVYYFASARWNYHSTLPLVPQAVSSENLSSVSLKGTTLVVGSSYRKGQGAVFIYKLDSADNTWKLTQEVSPPFPQAGQLFGRSVSFDGTRLAVGAPHFSRTTNDRAGAVFVYNIVSGNFTLDDSLDIADTNYANKGFGMTVAIEGNFLAIGSPQALLKESLGVGDVRIFQRGTAGWTQGWIKTPPAGMSTAGGLKFGASIALSGKKLLVGAPGHTITTNNNTFSGAGAAAYYADYTTATAPQVWVNPNQTSNGKFGTAVGLGSAGVFISAPATDSAGFVNHYTFAALTTIKFKMMNWNRSADDTFGSSIAVSGTQVIVGARGKSDPQTYSGAAFIYQMK